MGVLAQQERAVLVGAWYGSRRRKAMYRSVYKKVYNYKKPVPSNRTQDHSKCPASLPRYGMQGVRLDLMGKSIE